MRVSAIFERLWLVKKGRCKLIRNRFVIPHDTIPSPVMHKRKKDNDTANWQWKWNIKLGMKNETDRQITRHSLPTRMCFIFFDPPHKIFEILPAHIAHNAKAFRANAETKALSKSAAYHQELSDILENIIRHKISPTFLQNLSLNLYLWNYLS